MMTPIIDFDQNTDLSNWRIVDDVVMGGRSDGKFMINAAENAVFTGHVSLENNGGFSSIQHRMNTLNVNYYQTFQLRIKGDGKRYQFRVKSDRNQNHSYIQYFETTGDWQTITISFADMYPTFRGYKLDIPNFSGQEIVEMALLIGNGKAEAFELEIDWIGMQ